MFRVFGFLRKFWRRWFSVVFVVFFCLLVLGWFVSLKISLLREGGG